MKLKIIEIIIAILILSALVLIGVLINKNKSATGEPVYLELGMNWSSPLLIFFIVVSSFMVIYISTKNILYEIS